MRFGSVCSGIESASVAWEPLGWRASFLSEVEPFPRAVLAHRFPEVPLHGDFTTIGAGEYAAIDLLVGGTPCQDFSVAGRRAGLDGARGNLTLEYCRLADRLRPRWIVWENVPGVLSSNGGRDLGAFLGLLAELGYGFAWRVLDAQYVRVDGYPRAVPQRRQRVFLVGHLGDWRPAAAALLEPEGMCGHPPPRREAGKGNSGTVAFCSGGNCQSGGLEVAATLAAHGTRIDWGAETFVAEPIQFDTGQITSAANYSRPSPGAPCHPITAGGHVPAIAFSCKDSGADASRDVAPTLRAMGHDGSHANAGGQLAVDLAQGSMGVDLYGLTISGDIAVTLTTRGGGTATGPSVMFADQPAQAFNARQSDVCQYGDVAGTVAVHQGYMVRRMSVTECERLMGFPDGWTQVPYRGKPAADGPRYKALGNSKCVNVVRWVGQRIAMVDAILREREAA